MCCVTNATKLFVIAVSQVYAAAVINLEGRNVKIALMRTSCVVSLHRDEPKTKSDLLS